MSVANNWYVKNGKQDTAAAKTKNEEVERGKKRGSSFISEDDDGSQSSANKEAVHVYFDLIDKAEAEKRIDAKKASLLRACINSDDIIRALLCEQIPDKRPGNGYVCRVCKVPLKGHCCPYCPVCSTPKDKIKKNDSHTCKNCIKCFDEGKKRKKLVQLSKDKCTCKVRGTKS